MSVGDVPLNSQYQTYLNTTHGLGDHDPIRWVQLSPNLMDNPLEMRFVDSCATPSKGAGMRLIHYYVVDPDLMLAKEAPQLCIVAAGTRVLACTDDAFRMELASTLADVLYTHNNDRRGVTYQDAQGKPRNFQNVKIGDLDVVIQEIKRYG